MRKFRVIEDVPKDKWTKIVNKSPDATFFHTYEWANVMEQTFDYKIATKLFVFENDKEVLIPMVQTDEIKVKRILKFGIYQSMPFGCYGGLVSKEKLNIEEVESLTNYYVKRSKIARITIYPNPVADTCMPEELRIANVYTHILSLDKGFESIWKKNFNTKSRNQTRKAEREGVKVFIDNSLYGFKAYYDLYLDSAKRWGFKSPEPFSLFSNISDYTKEYTRLWLASIDKKVIAGMLMFYFNKQVIWWAGAFLKEYSQLNANNLLLKTAIRHACEQKYMFFNFGSSGNQVSVRKFKEAFGPKRYDYDIYRLEGYLYQKINYLRSIFNFRN